MRGIARLSDRDRSDLFREVAAARHLQPAIVEKDFWVCLTLDLLFHESPFADAIVLRPMIWGEAPELEELLAAMDALERTVNGG